MNTENKKKLAEKLFIIMMEMNDDDVYSAQNSIFGDIYNALKKIDIVDIDSTLNSGQVIYTKDSGVYPCAS